MKVEFKFECRELSFENHFLGFSITFSEVQSNNEQNKSIDELMNSKDKYLMIQRTYPEDEFETNYYYLEFHSNNFELIKKNKLILTLNGNQIKFENQMISCVIQMNLIQNWESKLMSSIENYFESRITIVK
ncbi:MAG: hypothetical protein LAT51_10725 [Flavobacteriaceae bacterium]|nr:hypothetical protein [Flavobacteriaceae bacterium]